MEIQEQPIPNLTSNENQIDQNPADLHAKKSKYILLIINLSWILYSIIASLTFKSLLGFSVIVGLIYVSGLATMLGAIPLGMGLMFLGYTMYKQDAQNSKSRAISSLLLVLPLIGMFVGFILIITIISD